MDRRLTPANARTALESLRGTVAAPCYTPGEAAQPRAMTRLQPQMPKKYATGAYAPVVDVPIDANFVLIDPADLQSGIDLSNAASTVVPPIVDPEPEPVDPPVVVDPTPVEPETPVTGPEPEPEPPIVDDTLPVPPAPPVRPTPDKPNPAPQPVKPAPKPTKPVVKYVTKTFQVDSYRARNAAQARLLASLDNDGVLKFREDGKLWNPSSAYVSYWQFVTVKVPANATKAQLIKAINAKTNKSVGDVRTTSKLASAKVGKRYTVAWELGRGAKPTTQLAWGANKKVNQIFLARS